MLRKRHLTIRFAILSAASLATPAALLPVTAHAQGRFGPYPYGFYHAFAHPESDVRVLVTPKAARVYVDGYYAGIVDEFDGLFQRLRVVPGKHDITLYLDGYRTFTEKLYLSPNSTHKLRHSMEKLAPGEVSEPPPTPAAPPTSPAGAYPSPRPGPPDLPRMRRMPPPPASPPALLPSQPQPPGAAPASNFGTLAIRVKPAGADVLIDGEHWTSADSDTVLIVQVSEGPHRVEIQKGGYRTFTANIEARRGDTTPLNVNLTPDRP